MRFRFLYLNEAGEEVEVGGVEELRACVAMGRVDENTLLYDSVTREWAPARAHSAYRMLADELTTPLPGGQRVDPTSGQIRVDEDLEAEHEALPELTPLVDPDLPDTQALFLERQERLRRLEHEEDAPSGPRDAFHVVDSSDELADRSGEPVQDLPIPERQEPDQAPDPPPERAQVDASDVPVPRLRATAPPRPIKRSPVGQRRRQVTALGGVVVVLLATWAILGRGDRAETAPLPTAPESPGTDTDGPSSVLPDAAAAAQGSAFQGMVEAMDSLRVAHGLDQGPAGWLDGHYLATASEYPHVRDYWNRYRTFVSELRGQDTALFRVGYLERLREDGLEGPVVQMRLARALDEFRSTQPSREALYRGMDLLAARSLELHELLLERESDVDYDPVQLGTVSRDPVVEAFPRDPELHEQIWQMLDGIFDAMEIVQGGVPGSRDQLGDAALREIRESGGSRR